MSEDIQPTPGEIDDAFLAWINLELGKDYKIASEFNDGIDVYSLCQRIAYSDFRDKLPESSIACDHNWVARFNNWKHIDKRLNAFIQENVDADERKWASHKIDYRDLAETGATATMTAFLRKLIVATWFSPLGKTKFLKKFQELPLRTQQTIVRTVQAAAATSSSTAQENTSESAMDRELQLENRLSKIQREKEKVLLDYDQVKEDLDALRHQHQELRNERDSQEKENTQLQERLIAIRGGDTQQSKSEREKQEAYISDMEQERHRYQEENTILRQDNEKLQQMKERNEDLQDQLDEFRAKQPELVRKAAAFEKYRHKAQSNADFEKENKELKAQLAEQKEEILKSDRSVVSSAGMRRELAETQKLLEQLERGHQEQDQTIKQLRSDNRNLETKNASFEAEHLRQQNEIESLERKLQQTEGSTFSGQRLDLDPYQPESSLRSPRQDFSALNEEQLRKICVDLESRNAELEGDVVSEDEMRHLLNAMKQREQKANEKTTEDQLMMQRHLAAKIGSGRLASKKTQQHISDQRALIAELQTRLDNAPAPQPPSSPSPSPSLSATTTQSPAPPSAAAADPVALVADLKAARDLNDNLTRELRLMASTWYDLQTRLQSPNVSVSRGRVGGTPEPKSWLGKQRKLVNGALMGR